MCHGVLENTNGIILISATHLKIQLLNGHLLNVSPNREKWGELQWVVEVFKYSGNQEPK